MSRIPHTTDGREARSERSAAAILLAARRAFARRGYRGASVREIARAARVNPALIGYHFGSKEKLYARVIDEVMGGLAARIFGAFAAGGETLAGRAAAAALAYLDYLATERDFPELVQRALLDRDPRVLRVARRHLVPLAAAAGPALAALGRGRIGRHEDVLVSLFGAVAAPFIYAPLLAEVFGEDLRTPDALERRRAHITRLVELFLEERTPP